MNGYHSDPYLHVHAFLSMQFTPAHIEMITIMINFGPAGIVGRAGALPEHKTVGAWHCGKRLDPPESALQVWRLSCVSLQSYILVNSMSVFINVRMTERLFGPALFLWCKPGLHSPHSS